MSEHRDQRQRIAKRMGELSAASEAFRKLFLERNPGKTEADAWGNYAMWRIAEIQIVLEDASGGAIELLEPNGLD